MQLPGVSSPTATEKQLTAVLCLRSNRCYPTAVAAVQYGDGAAAHCVLTVRAWGGGVLRAVGCSINAFMPILDFPMTWAAMKIVWAWTQGLSEKDGITTDRI
jgi:hypothetical protein